jgi:hypothetical protein
VTEGFGVAAETSIELWKPEVTTLTSSLMVVSGTPFSDQLKVTGARPNTAFTCSATLYGPYTIQQTEQATVPADAVKAGTANCSGTTDADGNATVDTSSLSAPAPGFYVWVGTLDAMVDESGNPVASAVTEGFGVAAETSIELWKPEVTTLTSSIAVVSGKPIFDTLKITKARPNTAFTCSATLYGPYETQQTEQATAPAGAVKAATATCSGTTDVDGKATVDTVSLNAPAPGFYVWVGTLDSMKDASGSPVASAVTEGFGIAAETSIVTVDSSGEGSGGGIDGGVPGNVSGSDLVWVVLLGAAAIGLGFAGAMRIRKVRPGPRRSFGSD